MLVVQWKIHRTGNLLVPWNFLIFSHLPYPLLTQDHCRWYSFLSGFFFLLFNYLTPSHLLGFSFNITSPNKLSLTLQLRIHSPVIHNRMLHFSVPVITPRVSAKYWPSVLHHKPYVHPVSQCLLHSRCSVNICSSHEVGIEDIYQEELTELYGWVFDLMG